jgi:hypothetical protein
MGLNWNEIKSRALQFSKTWADASNEDKICPASSKHFGTLLWRGAISIHGLRDHP